MESAATSNETKTQVRKKVILEKIRDEAIKKKEIKERNGNKCVYCGCTNKLVLTIDHKIPKIRGGTDEESNLQVCCWCCNQVKNNLTDEEFREYLPSLEKLYELRKIRVLFPQRLQVIFNPDYYPGFPPIAESLKDPPKPNPFGDQYPPTPK